MKHSAYIYNDRLCVFGHSIKHPEHRHYFIQIVARKPLNSDIIDIQLIASLEPHCMYDDSESLYFTVLIHPLSFRGLKIKEYLRLSGEKRLSLNNPDYFDFAHKDTAGNKTIILDKSNHLLSLFTDSISSLSPMDIRIRKSLRYIQKSYDLSIHAADVYTHAGLSESHFHMLFKQNIGISLTQAFKNQRFVQVFM